MDTQSIDLRARKERLAAALYEKRLRSHRKLQSGPAGLLEFVRYFWPVVEPQRPLIEGWPLEAICEHLEAVTDGQIKRLLMNVPPGFMKSLLSNVFWPAWEWGPRNLPSTRYIAASYSQALTVRDNVRFRNIIVSNEYIDLWKDAYGPSRDQFNLVKVANDKTGWKLATSVGGVGTGERADRFIIDDGNSVKEAESEAILTSTNQWAMEVVPTRLNSAEDGAIINIQQRTNEADISGTLLARDMGYVHLMIPMEFEANRRCVTGIGWRDPRTQDGELAWPNRFSARAVVDLKKAMGPYAVSGQFQQSPSPRGGGIIKREYWQLWEPPDGKFPKLEYILASADTAYTEKEENDPTGFVVLGLFKHSDGFSKVMLLSAWRKRLEIHGRNTERQSGETEAQWIKRTQKDWGLCEWLAYSCRRFKVDRLIIEGKASGLSVAQEMRRLHAQEGWGIMTVTPDGDKVARAYAVQSLFSDGLIYAPDREWAQMVIDEMAVFPKGSYKDLTDAMTQGLKHLREVGLAVRREERVFEEEDRRKHKSQLQPLYDV